MSKEKNGAHSPIVYHKILLKGIFLYNPVLVQALGFCLVIAVGTSLQHALVISLLTLLVMVPVGILANLLYKYFPAPLRAAAYVVTATLILLPAIMLMNTFMRETVVRIGIFLPLIAVNSMIIVRMEKMNIKRPLMHSIVDSVATCIGFAIVICISSSIREILGNGTLMGISLPIDFQVPAIMFPFFGFILLGLLAATLQFVRNKLFMESPAPTPTPDKTAD